MIADKSKKVAGDIGSLGLTDLIQLMGMTGRTATLILERGGVRGRIFFDEANVLHAEAALSKGARRSQSCCNGPTRSSSWKTA